MYFNNLVSVIEQTHHHFQQQAIKAVNVSLTIRNWLIGFYIVEFELKGEDRAKYGERIVKELANRMTVKGLGETNLKLSRQFYAVYPDLQCVVNSKSALQFPVNIRQILPD